MNVTTKQIAFFDTLLEEKQFPDGGPDEATLRSQFAGLNKKSASEWINKAMELPEKGTVEEGITTPPF